MDHPDHKDVGVQVMTQEHKVAAHAMHATPTSNEEEEGNEVSYVAWMVVFCVVLLNTAVNLTWLSASSAPEATSQWMQVSFTSLNWLSNICAILNTVVSLPTAWAYERLGIKITLVIAGFINMFGCWLRYLAIIVPPHHRFLLVIIGQSLAAIAGPLVTNISTKLAAVWFPPKWRGISNTLTTLSIGPVIALLLIPHLTPDADSTPFMFLVISIIGSIAAIAMPFLPRQPKVPPSHSATQMRMGVFEGIKVLAKQLDFWWLLILSSTGIGMALCFSAIFAEALVIFGYSEQQAGICVAVIIISGFPGGAVTGYWMGKTNDHRTIIMIFTPLSIFTYIMFIFQIIPNAFNVVILACIANGFFSYGLFSVYLELASEMTYPVPESVSNCIISGACSMTMFLFTIILDCLRVGHAYPQTPLIAAAIIVAVGSIPCFFLKGDMKRLAVDQHLESK
ncbi:major facilitator superfamily domain-containing protein [Halteromyces radiatus]|uniref:major facilitator superfamily domain-containing protein n=1 Tax=Halteromyces radiatus TaxID=101107 RepID=UPI002220E867|nr:major facilitator superfamily domain-containing protein [Halteromyces radiatus]KAI8083020.1 major facilitator superfamily domain-containing protein [Halteromyces radiatus]